jgi:hypothetical protein
MAPAPEQQYQISVLRVHAGSSYSHYEFAVVDLETGGSGRDRALTPKTFGVGAGSCASSRDADSRYAATTTTGNGGDQDIIRIVEPSVATYWWPAIAEPFDAPGLFLQWLGPLLAPAELRLRLLSSAFLWRLALAPLASMAPVVELERGFGPFPLLCCGAHCRSQMRDQPCADFR